MLREIYRRQKHVSLKCTVPSHDQKGPKVEGVHSEAGLLTKETGDSRLSEDVIERLGKPEPEKTNQRRPFPVHECPSTEHEIS